jgi:hypothetical protein
VPIPSLRYVYAHGVFVIIVLDYDMDPSHAAGADSGEPDAVVVL